MTEFTPNQPVQPQTPTEGWTGTHYYETMDSPNVMLDHGYKMPSAEPDMNEGGRLIRLNSTPSTPRPLEQPVAETAPIAKVSTQTAVESEPELSKTMRPEALRALRERVGKGSGTAAVSSNIAPAAPSAIIDRLPWDTNATAEKSPAVKVEISPQQQIEELEAKLREIDGQFSKDDQMNLWRYAAATMNKAEAQQAGDGQGSSIEGQNAGQAYTALSAQAKEVSGQYLAAMQRLQRIRNRV